MSLLLTSLPFAAAAHADEGKVVQEIVLIRHSIRSPTKAPEQLAMYANQPWASWPVAPGQLTHHGIELMHNLGGWYRQQLSEAGLPLASCAGHALQVIADTTPRNRASAAALVTGLSPGCATGYRALAEGAKEDPLFHGVEHGDATFTPAPMPQAAIAQLQQVLLGCSGDACAAQARQAGKQLLLDAKPAKALKLAGSLAENLMLEYVQGMPLNQVAWGRADQAGIGRLIRLHNISFGAVQKVLPQARSRGGNMLAHIAATLAHTAGQAASLPALAPSDTQALFLVGHDTDLASAAGLLNVDWSSSQQPDDYPPGGALIYQLLKSKHGYRVRLKIALPSLTALRAAHIDDAMPMHTATLRLPGCGGMESCPLPRFLALVNKQVGDQAIVPASGNEPLVP